MRSLGVGEEESEVSFDVGVGDGEKMEVEEVEEKGEEVAGIDYSEGLKLNAELRAIKVHY